MISCAVTAHPISGFVFAYMYMQNPNFRMTWLIYNNNYLFLQWCNNNGVENLKIAARREAERMPPFSLYSQAPIPGDYVEQDMKAQYILNQCRLGSLGIPSKTTGDGNCLFNATSIALSGNECLSGELRMRTAVEMALNADKYTSRDDHDRLLDHSPSYEASLHDCCTEGSYSSIWTIMALSTVVGLPIHSIYPPMNGTKCLTHLALSKKFETEESRNRPPITILWSRLGPWRPPTWTGNHFVPVLVREQVILPNKESRTTSPDVQATKVEKLSNSQTKVEKLSDIWII